MVLISHDRNDNSFFLVLFPSPYGDYGSYLRIVIVHCFSPFGFRPLTGIMVLIIAEAKGEIAMMSSFPSPYGDYGSYPHPL